jgi:hypothetical protein
MRLTAEDKQFLVDLAWEEQIPADPVEVTHFFSFPLNPTGAREAWDELKDAGFHGPLLEERDGDDFWHIAAKRKQSLAANVVAKMRVEMEELAKRHGGYYDMWDITQPARQLEQWQIRCALDRLRDPTTRWDITQPARRREQWQIRNAFERLRDPTLT